MSKRKLQDMRNLPKADSTSQVEKVTSKATKAESTEEKFVELKACLKKASNSGLEIKDFDVVSLPF